MRNKRTTRKKRIVSTLLAATVTFSVALAGTYAWRSVSQKALNEAKGNLNPGGRLHDDFNGLNLSSAQTTANGSVDQKVKYVYVENFTDEDNRTNVYARIRLDEYLETGTGAGKPSNDVTKSAQPLVAGTIIDDKTTWTPYKWDNDQTFRKYVTLSTGGDTVYMPTFNKDQDSLEADINGTLGGLDKNIETDTDDYSDYVKYSIGDQVNDIEIYDAEGDGLDKVKEVGLDVETIVAAVKDPTTGKFNVTPNASSITIDGSSYTVTKMEPDTLSNGSSTSDDITAIYVDLDPTTTGVTPQADIVLKTAEHTAQMTLDTDPSLDGASTPGILSMDDWDALPMNDKIGKYWVYDSEGWLYWAEPIEPSTATGCLLNGIAINDTTQEGRNLQSTEYYYGLNVVAQFASAGDWGDAPNETGFYKDGLTPEGKNLLDTISAMDNPETAYQVEISMQNANQSVAPGSGVQLAVKVENVVFGTEVTTDPTRVHWAIEQSSRNSRAVNVTPTNVDAHGLLSVAENETAQTLTVVATYNYDPYNEGKTVEGRFTINVTGELNYLLTIEPTTTISAAKGESITLTATAKKQIGNDTAIVTDDGNFTWNVVDAANGNTLSSNTSIDPTTGVLTVDSAETAAALKVTATYTVEYVDSTGASLGTKQWTAEKTITVEQRTIEQKNAEAAALGEKVTIGDLEFWKIYEGTERDTGKKVALLWQVEPEEDYRGKGFGTSPKWETSTARTYLSATGTYVNNHSKIKEMINTKVISKATIYTRGSYNDKSDDNKQTTLDYLFLLSPADLEGRVITGGNDPDWEYDTSPADFEYTTYGMTGNGTQLLTGLSNKAEIVQHIVTRVSDCSWLRTPSDVPNGVGKLDYTGESSVAYFDNPGLSCAVRPAFWIYL